MTFSRPPDTPLERALYRAPIWIYRLGLGSLLGRRFVLLTHRGRNSGEARQAVLEVVGRNDATGALLVASGYGGRSQWFRNIRREPKVLFQTGRHRHRGTAELLPPEESSAALAHYARRHPGSARGLLRALGHGDDPSSRLLEELGADPENGIPIVRLSPSVPPRPNDLLGEAPVDVVPR
ncbi:nitroreductase family deazaflavin-dependent oxidoreductase [Nocardiopsis alba]|uniref:nitroreductase family deazaflavin-dependent oxidoreductase n=1 Tax=Nocardiopsis alba TaxID=53437 RepID=UPI0033F130C2